MKTVRLAIADDSAFIRKALVRILEADQRISIVGTATCGEELLEHLDDWSPDVITLDLSMPGIGGLRTLDRIMEQKPTPVIILSTHAREDAPLAIEALHRGAVDFIDKQRYSVVDFQSLSRILIERILEISVGNDESKQALVESHDPVLPPVSVQEPAEPTPTKTPRHSVAYDLLIIAASTGGPKAIQTILEGLPVVPPVPVVLIQHMPPDFTGAFAERLDNHLPFAVRHASDGERLLAGTAYVAPGGHQLEFKKTESGLVAVVSAGSKEQAHNPSADVTFESAAKALGQKVLAVILTGMGKDGADGLAKLTSLGAHAIAQDRESSVVFGMPKAAIERGGVADVLSLPRIGPRLSQLLRSSDDPAQTPSGGSGVPLRNPDASKV